jgi:hypothetical protein
LTGAAFSHSKEIKNKKKVLTRDRTRRGKGHIGQDEADKGEDTAELGNSRIFLKVYTAWRY